MASFQRLLLGVGIGAMACAGGCIGNIGDGGSGELPHTSSGPLECDPNIEPSPSPLIRLSALQYENTLRDLFATIVDDAEVVEALAQYPADGEVGESFTQMDARLSQRHVDTFYGVSDALATSVTSDQDRLIHLGGPCAADAAPGADCYEDFLAGFGGRVLRRPLSAEEVAHYLEVTQGVDGVEGFRRLVFLLLMSPELNYHLEIDGAPIDREEHLALGAYEVASKLSYHFWQSMPDDELFDAAESGALLTEEGFRAQVERLFGDERTRATVRRFYAEWYRLEAFGGFAQTPAFEAFAEGVPADDALYAAMAEEIQALADHYTWETAGTYTDMMLSELSLSPSPALAALYGVAPWDGSSAPPTFGGERSGLLTRAAFLISTNERTNPFKRGSYIKREILCDPLSQPDPSKLPMGALIEPPIDPEQSTRDRFTAKTASDECQACHAQFNPIGFALEAYDGLGRFRTEENIWSEDGELLATVPVDTAVELRVGDERKDVSGPAELMQAMAESGKPDTCFARHYFRFTYRRNEVEESDGCALVSVRKALVEGGGLREALKAIALEASFRQRVVATTEEP